MDVNLYIYDLSKGLARMYSTPFTGTQIDAIYHTSIVLDGIEYYFGQGIQTAVPGSTHHGHPMEVVHLGRTELPKDVIGEYVESLGSVYSPESYDLFLHNCNNFTQDLAMFLVGRNIPEHIRNLPQTFLNTPFGQMMKPRIEMALRGVTQGTGTAGVPQPAAAPGVTPGTAAVPHGTSTDADADTGTVRIVSNLQQLETYISTATQTGKAAVIFFTSATCPPCKMVYPTYDELAEEAGERAVLLKIDLSAALDVGMKYGVRATPTFMTFLRGEKVDEWSGANPGQLRGNVRLLVEMQRQKAVEGQHPHCRLDVPSLQRVITQFVLYRKVPPLEKVRQKLGTHGDGQIVDSIISFVQARNNAATPADVPIPDTLPSIAEYFRTTPQHLPRENHFAVVDLARLLFLDPRVADYFAEREPDHKTLVSLLSLASSAHAPSAPQDSTSTSPDSPTVIPYNLRMVALQLVCNLFTSPLYTSQHIPTNRSLREACLHLATTVLLEPNSNPSSIPSTLRVTATSTLYNFAALNHNARITTNPNKPRDSESESEPLNEEEQVELTAATIEAFSHESDSGETVRGLAFALGFLVYGAEMDGAVMDVCQAMRVEGVLRGKGMFPGVGGVVREVGRLFNIHRTST